MSASRRFHSLRFRLVFATALFAVVLSLCAGAVFLVLSERLERQSAVQASEFNLSLVAASVEDRLEQATLLAAWGTTNTSVRRYLSDAQPSAALMLQAYNNAQAQYRSSQCQQEVIRFLLTNAAQDRYLQFGNATSSSAALTAGSVSRFPGMGAAQSTGWQLLAEDPLAREYHEVLAASRPITNGANHTRIGTSYIELSAAVLTGPVDGYGLADGSRLFWLVGGQVCEVSAGRLAVQPELVLDGEPLAGRFATGADTRVLRTELDGQAGLLVLVALPRSGLTLVQFLPDSAFRIMRAAYLALLCGMVVLICLSGGLLMLWLNRAVSAPILQLQKHIRRLGAGDFRTDPAIEWPNELGDIGRGINQLSVDISGLLDRRLADQKQKQDLEYQMLQNQVNPHFIYNTLNSIRWMATIQHAQGIAEMVTAFSRLLKSVSKGNEKIVPLQEELALLNDYFLIQQYRYGGDICAEVSYIESERICRDCRIPRFTLQPLAENAIFHGIEPKGGAGSILLDIRTDGEDVVITMTDDGVGMSAEQCARALQKPTGADAQAKFRHVGLWNVHRRIQYSFGERYGLALASEPGRGTTVRIRLPKTPPAAAGPATDRKEENRHATAADPGASGGR